MRSARDADLCSTFDAVVASYLELAASVLFTLHMEIRCEVILQIIESLQGNYVLEQASNEPDQAVLNVNADLVGFDEDLITYMRPQEHRLVAALPQHSARAHATYPRSLSFPKD